jgi:hypothetical protein
MAALSFGAMPGRAIAQPNASQRALDLAYEADDLFAKGKWDEAHARFSEADALAHSPVFVLFMARAKRNAGKLLEAVALYQRVADEKLAPTAPKPFRAAIGDAASELTELRGRIPRVRVVLVAAPRGAADVRMDDAVLEVDKSVAVDPGKHVFTAKVGDKTVSETIEIIAGGEERRVELSFAPAAERGDPKAAPAKRGSLAPGIAFVSLGTFGFELGAVMGGLATSTSSDVKENCVDNHCLASDADALDRARLFANVSTGALVAGGALMITGVVLLVVRPGGTTAPSVGLGPGRATLDLSF